MSASRLEDDRGSWWGVVALAVAAVLAASLTASAYWPGLMSWDPIRQYDEALTGRITDWHPPTMQWLWQKLLILHTGPAPMLLLQLGLYWGGLTLLASVMWRRRRLRLAWALLACGLFPLGLALTGAILKDSLMAGTLLLATALLAARGNRPSLPTTLGVTILVVFAAALRFNAFTACLPLMIAVLPRSWRTPWPRLLLTGLIATAALMAVMPIANRLIGATRSNVELSLIIFDLGGITEHSGTNVFPAGLDVTDPVRANHSCYRPAKWDSYSDWVDPECPFGFSAWTDLMTSSEIHLYRVWAEAMLAHPFAYAKHRLTHFAINTRLLPVADAAERPVQVADAPNRWGFQVSTGPALRVIDSLAVATAHTPLGWPIVWIALALGALITGWDSPNASLVVPLALSSMLYGMGYLVFSVAAELRYHLWTELAALIATVLVLADLGAACRRRILIAYIPALLTILAATAARS